MQRDNDSSMPASEINRVPYATDERDPETLQRISEPCPKCGSPGRVAEGQGVYWTCGKWYPSVSRTGGQPMTATRGNCDEVAALRAERDELKGELDSERYMVNAWRSEVEGARHDQVVAEAERDELRAMLDSYERVDGELEASIVRLQRERDRFEAQADEIHAAYKQLEAERDELQKAHQRLKGQHKKQQHTLTLKDQIIKVREYENRVLKAKAERDRLISEAHDWSMGARKRDAEILELRAERDRYRAALERIIEDNDGTAAWEQAHDALNGGTDD